MTGIAGQRILVTREADDCERWREQLAAEGANPVVFPCIECEDLIAPEIESGLREAATPEAWWLWTSPRAVDAVRRRLGSIPADLRSVAGGPRTAELLQRRGASVDFVGRGRGAVDAVIDWDGQREGAKPSVMFWPGSDRIDDDAVVAMRERGIELRTLAVYRTRPRQLAEGEARHAVNADVIFVASPSAVAGLVASSDVGDQPRLVSIGPRTSQAVREHGLHLWAEAPRATLEAMIEVTEETMR